MKKKIISRNKITNVPGSPDLINNQRLSSSSGKYVKSL